jgi:cellulose synthase/poly-beta-1,6-N-acetylglucosamine synthase-like glycosyltransferase
MLEVIKFIIVFFSVGLFCQALFSLYLTIYTWWQPQRLDQCKSPTTFAEPQVSFTVLLPARHEKEVIYQTIQRVLGANYPTHLIEIMVICEDGDRETIAEARRAFELSDSRRVSVLTFDDLPINKPHGLNVGLKAAHHQVVTVFDAEDDIHLDIFNVVNTVMVREGVRVIQCGVQLMNFRDHWFSALNVMEYYFWFKSRLHFHSRVGMIPLGGNTVFVERELLNQVGGWDEQCLTEDADLGIRLSLLGEPIRVIYDPQHVTKEETPDTLKSFVKQRTRWNQGFLQVLAKPDWRRLPKLGQKLLALYTLTYPLFQGALLLLWPINFIVLFFFKFGMAVTLPTFAPLYALFFQLLVNCFGLWEFTRAYKLRRKFWYPLQLLVTFIPFNLVLGYSALRAVFRVFTGRTNWEKTAHVGAHRAKLRRPNSPAVPPATIEEAQAEPVLTHSAQKEEVSNYD